MGGNIPPDFTDFEHPTLLETKRRVVSDNIHLAARLFMVYGWVCISVPMSFF